MSGGAEPGGETPSAAPTRTTPFRDAELTEDAFLGGRLKLLQPKNGYRAATDPVFLAAACPAKRGERVLDVGCGAGAAALCLAARVPGVDIEGVEAQEPYAQLARRNAQRNGVSWLVHAGDVARAPLFVRAAQYHHVVTNPPYFEAEAGPASPDAGRDRANRETLPLAEWIDFCLKRLRSKGVLTLVHRAERLPEILAALEGRAGGVSVLPLQARVGRDAKRVIVRAVKDSAAPFRLAAPLVLHLGDAHQGDGAQSFTPEAEATLQFGAPLAF